MQNVGLFALFGLGEGALIAALAISVVVFYRGSGTVNLSMGAIAMVASYVFYSFGAGSFGFTPPWWLALIGTLVFIAILGAIIELGLFWPLRTSSPLAKLAASLGLLLLAQPLIAIIYGNNTLSPTSILPSSTVHLLGKAVPVDRLILALIAVLLAAALWALYRFTQFGLATKAAAESEPHAMYAGLSPRRLSLTNSLLASVIAGAFGILVAPLITLNTTTLPLEIVPALGAALFAGFSSLGVACFAGLLMGAGASLLNYWASQSWFPQSQGNPINGLAELLFFVLVAIAMAWRGSKMPARGELTEKRMPLAPRPQNLARSSVIALVAGVAALIILPYDFRQALVNSMLGAMICLSLVVVIGFVGQISVVQVALAGVTGYAMSHMLTSVGGVWADFPLAPLVGIGCALIVGFITAVASLRVRGVSLAVVTLAGAVAVEQFGFGNSAWGAQSSGSPVTPLHVLGLNLSPEASFRGIDGKVPSPVFGIVVLVVLILLCLLVAGIRQGTIGQRMLAVRSNERAAAAAGIDVRRVKLTAFMASALIAGVCGVLYAYNFETVSSDLFGSINALVIIAYAYFGGITMISGALFAGLGATEGLIPHAFDRWFGLSGNWALLIGAIGLLVTLVANPDGIAGTAYWKRRQARQRAVAAVAAPAPGIPSRELAEKTELSRTYGCGSPAESGGSLGGRRAASMTSVFSARGVSVNFGGVRAVAGVDLEISQGELVGLVGPNGAGKTTFIDAITGFVRYQGEVELGGVRLDGLAPHARARRGLARTWQTVELFDDLTVRENLTVAVKGGSGGAASSVDSELELLDLTAVADAMPSELTQAERKRAGIGRALVARPRLLCLDEPAAGLDVRQSRELGRLLPGIAGNGTAVLLVDHDMGLVLNSCGRVVVLDSGSVIAQGAPAEIRGDERVIAAYLGHAAAGAA